MIYLLFCFGSMHFVIKGNLCEVCDRVHCIVTFSVTMQHAVPIMVQCSVTVHVSLPDCVSVSPCVSCALCPELETVHGSERWPVRSEGCTQQGQSTHPGPGH